jgi:CRISPR/Cas system-associated protein Csx1
MIFVLSKLVRNSPVDLEDARFLARTGRLTENILKQRCEKELRPYLANEKRHDLTLKLWLEACFHS